MYKTRQEIFNEIAIHLLTQNEKSTDSVRCLYRGPRGLKCAVGGIIPDEVYEKWKDIEISFPLVNGESIKLDKGLLVQFFPPELMEDLQIAETDKRFLQALQRIHDHNEPIRWRGRLLEEAASFGLDAKVVLEFPATPVTSESTIA
jgi:hypothetical protein